MKTMKYIFSVAFLIVGLCAVAQSTRMEKHYDRSFVAKPGGRLDITNKYGEVIIRAAQGDSVRIVVHVESVGKTMELVQKSMDRVDVMFRAVGDMVTVSTIVNKGSGMLKEILSEVDDYSKSVFGSNGLKVNYEVWLPENFNLNLENKFGNIYLADLHGRVSIDLAHGDLKANKLKGDVSIKHSFGKTNIDYVSNGLISLRGVDCTIRTADKLKIESSTSNLELGMIKSLQLNSRNDKIYIADVTEILGDGTFSDLNVDLLAASAHLNFNYGDIFFSRIKPDFKSMTINSKSADVNLVLDQSSYILTNILANEEKMIVPNSMLVLSKTIDATTGRISLSGFVGPTQKRQSQLTINSEGGEVVIAIKELPLYSDKR
jgi:hypothetical protein